MKTNRISSIVALCIVSESEIAKLIPNYQFDMEETNSSEFKELLFSLGIDVSKQIERQDGLQHRNRLNEIVTCSRYVGHERQDVEWINSGHASQEALDKYSGSRMVEDLYRARNLTEDRQQSLENRDKYSTPTED
jgi:hypothetical protein